MENSREFTVAHRIDTLNDNEIHYGNYKRGNSWLHCHNAFAEKKKMQLSDSDYDHLALNLAFYLASWGMYRGSSFLLDMDYKLHIEPVKMMMGEGYQDLFTIGNPFESEEKREKYERLLFGDNGIYKRLEAYYLPAHCEIFAQRQNRKNRERISSPATESDTLLTKILLGVYGCIPAYDRYFKKGLSLFDKQQLLSNNGNALFKGKKSLKTLLEKERLLGEITEYLNGHPDYTFMKVVDMYLFSLGAVVEEEKPDIDIVKGKLEAQYA